MDVTADQGEVCVIVDDLTAADTLFGAGGSTGVAERDLQHCG